MVNLIFILATAYAYITVPVKLSTSDRSSLNSFQENSATVDNYYNTQYYATFEVGTPGQSMSLLLDTASSWIWLPSTDCECHESTRFDTSASSTYWDTGVKHALKYKQGEVIGSVGTEDFSILGLSVWSQLFILATQDSDLDYMASDGVFGLGFGQLADGNPTFVENLKLQQDIDRSIFSFYFSSMNWENAPESVFTIGGHDSDRYGTGIMYIIDINPEYGYWMTTIDGISVGNNKKTSSKSEAIFSTSERELKGPGAEVKPILNKIKNNVMNCKIVNGLVECPCSLDNLSKYPTVTFYNNGQALSIRPENYLYHKNGKCAVLISEHSHSNWILGQPFFREYYTVHDMDRKSIYLWKARTHHEFYIPAINDESTNYIQSAILIPVGLLISGIVYGYRRRQVDSFNYRLV